MLSVIGLTASIFFYGLQLKSEDDPGSVVRFDKLIPKILQFLPFMLEFTLLEQATHVFPSLGWFVLNVTFYLTAKTKASLYDFSVLNKKIYYNPNQLVESIQNNAKKSVLA